MSMSDLACCRCDTDECQIHVDVAPPPPLDIDGMMMDLVHPVVIALFQSRAGGEMKVEGFVKTVFSGKSSDLAKEVVKNITANAKRAIVIGDYSKECLESIGGNINSSKQGCYADIISRNNEQNPLQIYVGGAAGYISYNGRHRGSAARISQHQNPEYRERNTSHHYRILDSLSTTSSKFIVLAEFSMRVGAEMVWFTETILTILFGAWDNALFRRLRPSILSPVPSSWDLNRANPLWTGKPWVFEDLKDSSNPEQVQFYYDSKKKGGDNAWTAHRAEKLNEVRRGMKMKVCTLQNKDSDFVQRAWYNLLGLGKFYISFDSILKWKVTKESRIMVHHEIREIGPHPQQFALSAPKDSSAARLGIRVSTTLANGQEVEEWLCRENFRAIMISNTLVDWMNGEWKNSNVHKKDRWPLQQEVYGSRETKGLINLALEYEKEGNVRLEKEAEDAEERARKRQRVS